MSDRISRPVTGTGPTVASGDLQSAPYLTSEPAHFFSNDFRTNIVRGSRDEEDAAAATPRRDGDWGIVLMIATIGAPILAYCVFSAM